eukprot:6206419-Pleurochrysis_carterae.AAC.1
MQNLQRRLRLKTNASVQRGKWRNGGAVDAEFQYVQFALASRAYMRLRVDARCRARAQSKRPGARVRVCARVGMGVRVCVCACERVCVCARGCARVRGDRREMRALTKGVALSIAQHGVNARRLEENRTGIEGDEAQSRKGINHLRSSRSKWLAKKPSLQKTYGMLVAVSQATDNLVRSKVFYKAAWRVDSAPSGVDEVEEVPVFAFSDDGLARLRLRAKRERAKTLRGKGDI